jgi:hypothetical protein
MVVLLLWKHGYDKHPYPVYHELKGCYQSASASFIVSHVMLLSDANLPFPHLDLGKVRSKANGACRTARYFGADLIV